MLVSIEPLVKLPVLQNTECVKLRPKCNRIQWNMSFFQQLQTLSLSRCNVGSICIAGFCVYLNTKITSKKQPRVPAYWCVFCFHWLLILFVSLLTVVAYEFWAGNISIYFSCEVINAI